MRIRSVLAALALAAAGVVVAATPSTAADTVTLRFVTFNVNFHDSQAQIRDDWQTRVAPNADIAFLQEAKYISVAAIVNTDTWLVLQDTSSEDRAGSAVVIRRSVIKDRENHDLIKGVDGTGGCPGHGLETRWIDKVGIKLMNNQWIRVASLHMPPADCQTGPGGKYDVMAGNVVDFVRNSDRLTVLGADWNKNVDDDPNDIGSRSNLETNGPDGPNADARIDGFMYSKKLTNCCVTRLGSVNSDHQPVQITLTIPSPIAGGVGTS